MGLAMPCYRLSKKRIACFMDNLFVLTRKHESSTYTMSQKTRRKRRQASREQKKLAQQKNEDRLISRKRLLKRIGLWMGAILGLAILVFGLIKITEPKPSEDMWLADSSPSVEWAKGNRASQIHLVEYSDFQCSFCAKYHRITKKVIDDMGEDVRLTFRHYPLKRHVNAELAAISAEAAGRQGKFWEMHDLLFERQNEWANKGNQAAEKLFIQYAKDLNLNSKKFRQDLGSQVVLDEVRSDYQSGQRSGVNSTPTFFLNGRKILQIPQTYETLKALILKTKRNLS